VVPFSMRERETLSALSVRDGVLVLETMLWADEIREPDFEFLDSKVEPKAAELKMAELLIDSLSTDFDPADYHDAYREALEEVIEAKVEGREVVTPPEPTEGGAQVIDLMAALKASVDAAKKTAPSTSRKTTSSTSKKAATPARAAKGARGAAKTADPHKPARKKPAAKSTSPRRQA
jgi:DNA end-binding protein Ku